MEKFKFIWTYFFVLIALNSSNIYASLSQSDQDIFSKAGFTVKPLDKINPADGESYNLATKVNLFCDRNQIFASKKQDVYFVTDYRKHPGKTAVNYAPAKDSKFDSLILSRYKDENPQGFSGQNSQLKGILDSWVETGFSCHSIIPAAGGVVFWVDPNTSKGQMAGPLNKTSLEALVGTPSSQAVLPHQINNLNFFVNFSRAHGDDIGYGASHSEARGSGYEGTITNIDEVRGSIGLKKKG